jgi:hypothetical protein
MPPVFVASIAERARLVRGPCRIEGEDAELRDAGPQDDRRDYGDA